MNGVDVEESFKSLTGARDTCSNLLTQWLDDLQELWGEVGIPPEQQITRIKVVSFASRPVQIAIGSS